MIVSQVAQNPVFPRGFFQKAFFFLGLGTALYFSYQTVSGWFSPSQSASSVSEAPVSESKAFVGYRSANEPAQFVPSTATEHARGNVRSYPLHAAAPQQQDLPVTAAPEAPVSEAAAAPAEAKTEEAQSSDPAATDPNAAQGAEQPVHPTFQGFTTPYVESAPAAAAPVVAPVDPMAEMLKERPADRIIPAQTQTSNITLAPSSSSTTTDAVSNLSTQDLALLTRRALTATAEETMSSVSGSSCTQGSNAVCSPQTAMNVSNTRWDVDHGIKNSGVSFSVQNTSGAPKFNFSFTVQDRLQHSSATNVALQVTESHVADETIGNASYKVFRITFADTTIAGESAKQVKLVLVYQGDNLVSVPSVPNELSFVRSGFSTVGRAWITDGNNSVSASEPVLKPDAQKFNFRIQ